MVVKNQIKLIKSLQQKKYRNQHGMFVVEGVKTVNEFLNSHFTVEKVYVTQVDIFNEEISNLELATQKEMKQMSGMHSPSSVLGVFHIPKAKELDFDDWILALDDVQNPGNLGTIIRLCDWFGIKNVVCSAHTVDCYNPKVLQATMGSLTRVNIGYTDLEAFLNKVKVPIYGTFMNGVAVDNEELPSNGILVMGNEANGICNEVEAKIPKKLTIPQYGSRTTESLNVATATAIFLNEIRRS